MLKQRFFQIITLLLIAASFLRAGGAFMPIGVRAAGGKTIDFLTNAAAALGGGIFALSIDLFAALISISDRLPGWLPYAWIVSAVNGFAGIPDPNFVYYFNASGVLCGVGLTAFGIKLAFEQHF